MIEKMYYDETTKEEDLKEFASKEEVKKIFRQLEKDNEIYTIGIDVASKKFKDFACMSYFKKNEDGNLIFVKSKIIK